MFYFEFPIRSKLNLMNKIFGQIQEQKVILTDRRTSGRFTATRFSRGLSHFASARKNAAQFRAKLMLIK